MKQEREGGGRKGRKEGKRERDRGVNLLEDINSRKRTWSLAVTLPTATTHRFPLPFLSPAALLSTHLLHSSGTLSNISE